MCITCGLAVLYSMWCSATSGHFRDITISRGEQICANEYMNEGNMTAPDDRLLGTCQPSGRGCNGTVSPFIFSQDSCPGYRYCSGR